MRTKKIGYRCPKCRQWNDAGAWGAAHWMEELVHRCGCGRTNRLRNGEVQNPPREKKR